MIEILAILIQIIIITIFCFPPKYLLTYGYNKRDVDIVDHLSFGIVINILLLLVLSLFFSKENRLFFYFVIFFIFSLNLIFLINEFIKKLKIKDSFKINFQLLILLVLVFIFSVHLSNNLKLGWDAQNIWIVKMLSFFNNGNMLDLKMSPRNDYPHLGSFLWFFYSKISLFKHEYFGRIFYIYLFVLSILSISKLFKISIFEFLLLSLGIIFFLFKIDLFNGHQEIINFSLIVFLSKNYFYIFDKSSSKKIINFNIFYTFIIFFILLWVKNESIVLITISLLSFFITSKFKTKNKIIFLFIFLSFLTTKYIIYYYFELPIYLQKDNYENFNINNLDQFINLERFLLISKYLFYGLLETLILPFAAFSLLILIIFDKKNNLYIFLLSSLIFGIFFVFIIFFTTSFPIEWHLKTSINRIIFQISGFFIILIPLIYNFLSKKRLR